MDELEDILGKSDWKPSGTKQEIPKSIPTPPDALVLINLVTTCSCGEKFSTPNKRLMLRFKKNLLGMHMWRAGYNDLPREIREVEEKVLACLKCFDDTYFSG